MARQRYINTKLWSDNWISDLDPVEKLLFLYILTNERTNIAGIYELPLKIMAVETGIEKDMIEKILKRFESDSKVAYFNGWIYIKNFIKHQDLENEKIKKGIELIIESIPREVIDSLHISHPYPSNYSNTNTNTNNNTNNNIILSNEVAINSFIPLFKELNPSYKTFYANKTQRNALERLLKEHGEDKITHILEIIPKTNAMPYSPTITTPLDLEKKLGALLAFMKKKQIKETVNKITTL